MYLTNKATKRPQKPSAWWGFDRQYSSETCQSFDLMMEVFDDWLDERTERTTLEPVPKRNADDPVLQPVPVFRGIREILGYTKPEDRADGTAPDPPVSSFSASEAELLQKFETGDGFTEAERKRFGQ